MGADLILRKEETFVVALAGVIAQIFVHWAINVDATRQTSRPNGQKYRFDPLNRTSTLRRIKPAPSKIDAVFIKEI